MEATPGWSKMPRVTHPYRTPPPRPPHRAIDPARLQLWTFAFGFVCVVAAAAVSGVDRAKCALLGTLGGVAALMSRPRPC